MCFSDVTIYLFCVPSARFLHSVSQTNLAMFIQCSPCWVPVFSQFHIISDLQNICTDVLNLSTHSFRLSVSAVIPMFMWSVSSGRDLHTVILKGTILFPGLMVGLYSFLLYFFFFYINNAKSVISAAISGICFIALHFKIKWCFVFLCCWFVT